MNVLISGAGVAGPTLAYFLARTGAKVTIVEKVHALLPHGQNIDVQGSAVTVIKKMGLFDELRRLNTREKGTRFVDTNGRPYASFPIKENSTMSLTSEFEILRGDLAAMLYRASKDHPNIKYFFSTTVEQVLSNDDQGVRVKLSNGQEQDYDLLVAADGQWSNVRKQCFAKEAVKVIDKDMYAVYYTVPRLASDDDFWSIYVALESKIVTIRPDPHGTMRAMFTLMPCDSAQKQAWQSASRSGRKVQQELIKKEFPNAGWQAQRFLDEVDQSPDFYFQAIQQIRMSKWSSSRVVCLGDAAHAPTPLAGGGTTLAITGAYILAGELAKLKDIRDIPKSLEAYETAFRPHVDKTQDIPSIFPSVAHPRTVWKRWLLKSCLGLISKVVAVALNTPWIARKLDSTSEQNDDGFPLPEYASVDARLDTSSEKGEKVPF